MTVAGGKRTENGEENLRSAKLALNIFCKEKRASTDDMWKSLRRNEEMWLIQINLNHFGAAQDLLTQPSMRCELKWT